MAIATTWLDVAGLCVVSGEDIVVRGLVVLEKINVVMFVRLNWKCNMVTPRFVGR
jgi:hypothetical protein